MTGLEPSTTYNKSSFSARCFTTQSNSKHTSEGDLKTLRLNSNKIMKIIIQQLLLVVSRVKFCCRRRSASTSQLLAE
ncbi:hypothetical protein Ahia01_000205300 [Argonauta hians]